MSIRGGPIVLFWRDLLVIVLLWGAISAGIMVLGETARVRLVRTENDPCRNGGFFQIETGEWAPENERATRMRYLEYALALKRGCDSEQYRSWAIEYATMTGKI